VSAHTARGRFGEVKDIAGVGAVIWLLECLGLPLGQLPGDMRMRGEGWSFHFPIVTSIVVSVVLTVLLNILFWLLRR
jgi:hypothetical protein